MPSETRAQRVARHKAAHAAELERKAKALAIVQGGVCPQCGAPLTRNITMTGWYQCAGYGKPGFRGRFDGSGKDHPEYDALPACSFQVFV